MEHSKFNISIFFKTLKKAGLAGQNVVIEILLKRSLFSQIQPIGKMFADDTMLFICSYNEDAAANLNKTEVSINPQRFVKHSISGTALG